MRERKKKRYKVSPRWKKKKKIYSKYIDDPLKKMVFDVPLFFDNYHFQVLDDDISRIIMDLKRDLTMLFVFMDSYYSTRTILFNRDFNFRR